MPNKNGDAYGLTALFPVKGGVTRNITEEEQLRAYLAKLPRDSSSPFARAPLTHFARFVVIDRLGFNGEPSLPDSLASPCLLWTACFNGELDPWLAAMWQGMQGELEAIFSHCAGYQDYPGKGGFMRYVKRGQITTSFLFADYPYATVEEVLDGLKLKKHFVNFVVDNQGGDPAVLKANFFAWMQEMEQTPSPAAGSTY